MTDKYFRKHYGNLKTYEDYINYLIQNSKDLKADAIKNEISDAIITISDATSNLKELLGYINKNKDKLIENNKSITSIKGYKEFLYKISNSVNHLYSMQTLSKNKDLPNNDVYYKYHHNYEDYIVKRIDNKFLNVKFCKVSNVNSIEWFSNENLTNKFEQDNYNTNNKNKNLKEISKEKAEKIIEKIWKTSNNNLNNNGRNNI